MMSEEFLSYFEKRLLVGYEHFTTDDKNQLIVTLAKKNGLMYSQITEEYILEHHKNIKKEILSDKCEETIISGFTASNGHRYRLNRDDQINLMGRKEKLLANPSISTVLHKTEDVGYIEHTREDWLQVYDEAFEHKESNLFKYDSLKKQLNLATSHGEIQSISWDDSVVE